VDFPRAGNGWSHAHARRQWSLVDAPGLLYKYLAAWDAGMHALEDAFPWLLSRGAWVSTKHGRDKVVVFDRDTPAGPLVFAFNLHPTASYAGYRVGAPAGGEWAVALCSDDAAFGGHGRVDGRVPARAAEGDGWNGRPSSFLAYLPARTCVVWKRAGTPVAWA